MQLLKDKPHGETIFYKSLPIDVEAWIRSLCEFPLDTHVPRWWCVQQSYRFRNAAKDKTFAELGICNEVKEANDMLVCLASSLIRYGVDVKKITPETYSAVRQKELHCKRFSSVTMFRHKSDVLNLGQMEMFRVENIQILRPTQTLEFEEVIGVLHREGSILCVGTRKKLLHGFFLSSEGEVQKKWHGHIPHYIIDYMDTCATKTLWTIRVDRPSFSSEDPLDGADCVLTVTDELNLETFCLIYEAFESDVYEHFIALSSCIASAIRDHDLKARDIICRTSSTESSDCNIVSELCMKVKRKNFAASLDARVPHPTTAARDTWTGEPLLVAKEVIPRKCRNAWISSDGKIIEKTNLLTMNALHDRMRWPTSLARCHMCPDLHVDKHIRQSQACSSRFCKTKFHIADSGTHVYFRDDKSRRVEVDKSVPLFTDVALLELEKYTSFKKRETLSV